MRPERMLSIYRAAQAILRALALLTSIASLVTWIYMSLKWDKTEGGFIAAACIAMVTDSYCLVCLIMVPDVLERSTLGCVILGDVTTFIITLVSFLLESLDNPVSQRMLDPPPGEPWYEFESQASVVLVVVFAWRILLIIWNCFDCCRHPFRPRDHTDHNLVHIRPSIDQM